MTFEEEKKNEEKKQQEEIFLKEMNEQTSKGCGVYMLQLFESLW